MITLRQDKNMNTFNKVIAIALFGVSLANCQMTTTSTTFSATVNGKGNGSLTSNGQSPSTVICLTSSTGVTANPPQSVGLMAGREYMIVNATTPNANCWSVTRGYGGTAPAPHSTTETVYVGPTGGGSALGYLGSPFINTPPSGGDGSPCNSTSQDYLPLVMVGSEGYQTEIGSIWNCLSGGVQSTGAGTWYQSNTLLGAPAISDFEIFVPASGICVATHATGSAGSGDNTTILDGSVPALKSDTTAGAGTAGISCNLTAAMRTVAGKGITLGSIGVIYGVQTTTATSMATPTISLFNAPAAGTSETASSATLVTTTGLVGGTLTMTPAVASANLTAVSAGQYYTENIALGTPLLMNSDLRTYVFTFAILQSASAIQIMTVPGIWLRGTYIPL